MRAQLIIILSVVLAALLSPVMAGTGTITISGNSTTNATSTVTGVNTVVTISAWNTGNGVKTFKVNVTNASDDLTFYLYNFTGLKVNEFKLNSTPQNGYQANSTGVITFTYTQTTGNATYNVQPAVNQGGFNYTWAWFTNLIAPASSLTGVLPNASLPTSAMNVSSVRSIAISYTRDMTAATGNVSYTGAGFRPTSVDIFALHSAGKDWTQSTINSDLTYSSISSINGGTLAQPDAGTPFVVYLQTADSTLQQANITSIDADGITLGWLKTGSPTGTGYLKITYHR